MNAPSAAPRATAAPVIQSGVKDGIAVISLNRPKASNSLSEAMLEALSATFAEIGTNQKIRAVVLGANGSAFCAGHDLKEITQRRRDADGGRAYVRDLMDRCSAMMQAIHRMPQPVIAAVEGAASAAGCQLVASCDLAVASKAAKFATPGVQLGLCCSTPMVALSRTVTPKPAMEMLLTGDLVSAEEACRIGLSNRVVAPGTERDEACKVARKLAAKSSLMVKLGKEAF